MKIKWLCSYYHGGRLFQDGDICDVSDECGAGHVKNKRAVEVSAGRKIDVGESLEVAAVEPQVEKAVARRGRPKKA